jgi:PAS domain S-box-containing protein
MRDQILQASSHYVRDTLNINRELMRKALHMRCLSYLSQAKAQLLTKTIFQVDKSKKQIMEVNKSLGKEQNSSEKHRIALEKTNRELVEAKKQLEKAVKSRTKELERTNDYLNQSKIIAQKERDRAHKYLEIAEAIIIGLAPDGTITVINAHGCRVLGLSKEEIIGESWFDRFIPKECHDEVKTVHEGNIKRGVNFQEYNENLVINAQGKERTIYWHNTLELDQQGDVIGTLSSGQDITQRKLFEIELQDKQEVLKSAQEISHFGNWTWNIAENSIDWSDEIFRIFGFPVQSFTPTYEQFLASIHPEDRDELVSAVNISLEDPSQPYNIEHRIVQQDGTIRFVHEKGYVYRDEYGQPIRMLGTVQDISEQKRIENELRESESRFRDLFNSVPASVVVVDKEGILEDINQFHLDVALKNKVDKESYLGNSLLSHPVIVEAGLSEKYRAVLNGESINIPECYFPQTTGGIDRYYNVRGVPLQQDGKLTGALFLHDDVSDMVRIKKTVEANESMFRSLLNAIDDPLVLFTREKR